MAAAWQVNGVLIVNKTPGVSSAGLCRQVGRLLGATRMGHAGTLDPFASGVLPLCLGSATKVAAYLTNTDKTYRAKIFLGRSTDTDDCEGRTLAAKPLPAGLNPAQLEKVLQAFRGDIVQRPPIFSAKKVSGTPSYRLARSGKAQTLPLQNVRIHRLEIRNWQPPFLELEVFCSKGTYIRGLARDLGEALGCGAHVVELCRLRHGPFDLQQAVSLEQIQDWVSGNELTETLAQHLLSLNQALGNLPGIRLQPQQVQYIRNGRTLNVSWLQELIADAAAGPQVIKVLDERRNLVALVRQTEVPEAAARGLSKNLTKYEYLRVFK